MSVILDNLDKDKQLGVEYQEQFINEIIIDKNTLNKIEQITNRNDFILRKISSTINLSYEIEKDKWDNIKNILEDMKNKGYKKILILELLENMIKDGGRICIATPHYMEIKDFLEGTKFEILEQHHIRMHKSLTRVISLLSLV